MDKLFIDAMLAFAKSSMSGRDSKAFKCLWTSILMFFWEILKTLGNLAGAAMRLGSIVLSAVTAGLYILVGHPILLVLKSARPDKPL